MIRDTHRNDRRLHPSSYHRARRYSSVTLLAFFCLCLSAHAGPPFVTDDPEPVELHHVELNLAFQVTRSDAGRTGVLAADTNWGCAPELQCHVAVPVAFAHATGVGSQAGVGDAEMGVKFRFFNDTGNGLLAAIYPTMYLPTGDVSRGLGNGGMQVFLPLWLQKSSGPWIWDAGGGYLINRAAGARNSWFTGLVAQRSFGDGFKLGAELFHRTAVAQDVGPATGFNVGAIVKLSTDRNLLVSVGRGCRVPVQIGALPTWRIKLSSDNLLVTSVTQRVR